MNNGDTMEVVGQRVRVSGQWGTAKIIASDGTSITIEWPWYWRALNWARDRWRRDADR